MLRLSRLSFFQMFNMSVGFLGIQFAWAIQMGQMSALYERLGATSEQISWFWIAGPITGIIVQPIIGNMSDRTWNRFGRRRPYFLIGAILASCVLVAMPNSPALWVAASLLWIMDASINISMEPFRAFVADVAPEEQRGTAYSFQSFAIGLGSVLSFGIGAVMIPLHTLFYLGAGVFMTAIIWTVLTTREYPPDNIEEFKRRVSGKKSFFAWIGETWTIILNMPQNMRKLCLVHSFTWFGFFCMFIFFSPMIAANVFHAVPNTPAYDEGIAWASLCYLALNVVCFISSAVIGGLAKVYRKKVLHAVNLSLGGLALISMFFVQTKLQALAAMGVIGIAWASTLSLPYALLSGSVPPERYGIFMGAFNIFICLPQIVCSIFAGPIVAALGGDKAVALFLGGCSMILAAFMLKRVKEEQPVLENGKAGLYEKAAETAC